MENLSGHHFVTQVYNTAVDVLGYAKPKHRDRFDENDPQIKSLLDSLHSAHSAWLESKNNPPLKGKYIQIRREAQCKFRQMKNTWWEARATEIQQAADTRNAKKFDDGLKAIYGPQSRGMASLCSTDNSKLITHPESIINHLAEHFDSVLNVHPSFLMKLLMPYLSTPRHELDILPPLAEATKAISQLSMGKSPGNDGIPPEIFHYGGQKLKQLLTNLFQVIWNKGQVPQDFKDAILVPLYKRKGDRTQCDNYRGLSLLSIAGKKLSRIILNRLMPGIAKDIIPESQCGFQPHCLL